jgi:hypothetical protein
MPSQAFNLSGQLPQYASRLSSTTTTTTPRHGVSIGLFPTLTVAQCAARGSGREAYSRVQLQRVGGVPLSHPGCLSVV